MKRLVSLILAAVLCAVMTVTALADTATVKGGWLRLRAEPSFNSETLASYYTGTVLTVLSKSGNWYRVQAQDGKTGYMYASYLTVSSSSTPSGGDTGYVVSSNGRGVRLRAQPAVGNNVIGLYNVGTRVKILSRGTDWHYVQIGNTSTVGYMMAQYISASQSGVQPTSGGYAAYVTSANGKPVRLRSGPGTGYSVINVYAVGTMVTVLKHGATWDQVRVGSGATVGYMMNQYLTTTAPVSPVQPSHYITAVAVSSRTPAVGNLLYAVVTPSSADYICQWYNDYGTLLSTGASYQVKSSDLGRSLRVRAVGKGSWAGSISSDYTAPVGQTVYTQSLTNVYLDNANPGVGDMLTAYAEPYGATASYSWYRDSGKLISTNNIYIVQAADVGSRLYCVAVGTGGWTGTVVSASTGVVASPVTPAPVQPQTLSGSVTIPNGAVVGTEIVPDLSLSTWAVDFAWYQNGVLISTNATLYLTSDMAGDDVRLVVTAQPNSGFNGSVGSNYCYVQKSVNQPEPGLIQEI